MVEGQCRFYVAALHENKREAIRERVSFVWSILKAGPPRLEEHLGLRNDLHQLALTEPPSNFHGLRVATSVVEERYDLIEYVGRRTMEKNFGSSFLQCLEASSWFWSSEASRAIK